MCQWECESCSGNSISQCYVSVKELGGTMYSNFLPNINAHLNGIHANPVQPMLHIVITNYCTIRPSAVWAMVWLKYVQWVMDVYYSSQTDEWVSLSYWWDTIGLKPKHKYGYFSQLM